MFHIKKITRFIKKSRKARRYMVQCQVFHEMPVLTVIQECCTRWNSALEMIKRVLRLKGVVNRMFVFLRKYDFLISNEHVQIMEEIVNCFEPFLQATLLLSGQEYPTSCLIRVVNQDMENACEETVDDSQTIKEMKQLMKNKLETRNVRESAQKLINVTCILDPRFKQVIIHSQDSINELISQVVKLHTIKSGNNKNASEMSQSQIPGTQS